MKNIQDFGGDSVFSFSNLSFFNNKGQIEKNPVTFTFF